jgi:Chaperone of endosialidase
MKGNQIMKNPNAILITIVFVCFGLLPGSQAVSPSPDGGYPGENTAEGTSALLHLNGGTNNTAVGWASLGFNVTGGLNTAVGAGALLLNTAYENTATGAGTLLSNTTGNNNTADGAFALFSNTEGELNTAVGDSALLRNTIAGFNTAIGANALGFNTEGDGNTAIGEAALLNVTSGHENTGLGEGAGYFISTAYNVICIGAGVGGANVPNSCFVGNIYGVTTISGTTQPVVVSDSGQLGTISSSRRFKKDIKPLDNASESVLSLKPVTFHYKSDTKDTPQFGLIAEDVAEVNPDLVVRDKDGKPYTVRYDQVNAMLLNEFLKEHRKVEEEQETIVQLKSDAEKQTAKISKLEKGVSDLTAQLKEQAAQIQKVNTRSEASRAASRVAVADP